MNDLPSDPSQFGPIGNTLITNPLINAFQIEIPSNKEKKQAIFRDASNQNKINYVARLILSFCYPTNPLPPLITFPVDANSGPLPCIFQNIDNGVSGLATAMTIADSATGGVDEKTTNKSEEKLSCNKQSYQILLNKPYQPLFFPFNDYSQEKRRYKIESTLFIKDKYNLYYVEKDLPFSSVNKDSIILRVIKNEGETDQIIWDAPFRLSNSGKAVSGVELPTLKQLIEIIESNAFSQRNRDLPIDDSIFDKQLNLNPIIQGMWRNNEDVYDIIGFLLDYKRAGDYEQVNSTKQIEFDFSQYSIFCTGDELCSIYSRIKKLPNVFTHGDFIDIYRFPLTAQTEEQQIQQQQQLNLSLLRQNASIKNKIQYY